MSEIQTNTPEDSKFLKRAAAITAAGIVGTGAWAVGANLQNEHNHEIAQEVANAQTMETANYDTSIENAVNASYDANQVAGTIYVTEGSNLGDPAISIVKSRVGEDAYNDIRSRIFSPLNKSAESHNPQPGETYAVVSTDINREKADGNEFIVVDSSHISKSEVTTIPSPVIEDSSSTQASN